MMAIIGAMVVDVFPAVFKKDAWLIWIGLTVLSLLIYTVVTDYTPGLVIELERILSQAAGNL